MLSDHFHDNDNLSGRFSRFDGDVERRARHCTRSSGKYWHANFSRQRNRKFGQCHEVLVVTKFLVPRVVGLPLGNAYDVADMVGDESGIEREAFPYNASMAPSWRIAESRLACRSTFPFLVKI